MDIENPKTSFQSKQNPKSQIDQSKQKILKLKLEIMQIVCATFYPNEHRCLLSYIITCALQEQQIKDDDLSIFHNYSSLIVDLRDGYFISNYDIFQKKQGKRDKKVTCYKLDITRFFKLIAEILKDLQTKLKKIKEFYLQSEKSQGKEGEQKKVYKRCKNCHTKQNIHMQDFGFDSCQKCKGNQFEDVVINEKQKARIDKLNEIIMIVFGKLKEIKDLDSGLQNQIEINEQKKQVKVSEIDHFMNPFVKYLKERHEYVELDVNIKTIKQAEKLQAPPTQYQKVKDMIRARQARERTREKDLKNNNDQTKIKSS